MPGKRNDTVYKKIKCLKCRKQFQSNNKITNRICNECKHANSLINADESAGASRRR